MFNRLWKFKCGWEGLGGGLAWLGGPTLHFWCSRLQLEFGLKVVIDLARNAREILGKFFRLIYHYTTIEVINDL